MVPIGKVGELKIPIINNSEKLFKLGKGKKIATCFKLAENWQVNVIDFKPEILTTSNISNTLADTNKQRDTDSRRDWVAEFNLTNEHLTPQQIQKLCQFFDEYADVCSKGDFDLGRTPYVEHVINTRDNRPIRQPL